MIRHAWGRLIRKQWLLLYPLALTVINALAFLAVYAAGRDTLRWSAFFTANFERWQYVRDQFFADFSFTPTLGVAVFVGLVACLLAAMTRAPFFRAIAGPRYPLAPRNWKEVGNLFLFYLFASLVTTVLPLALPTEGIFAQLTFMLVLVISILIVFADYVIVYEGLGFLAGLRRSVRLLGHRWIAVLLIFIVVLLVWQGVFSLYSLYYREAARVFILLPISQVLVESLIVLFTDLVLIFLYEEIRRRSPA